MRNHRAHLVAVVVVGDFGRAVEQRPAGSGQPALGQNDNLFDVRERCGDANRSDSDELFTVERRKIVTLFVPHHTKIEERLKRFALVPLKKRFGLTSFDA